MPAQPESSGVPPRVSSSRVKKKLLTFLKRKVRIRSQQGLHARPAALFVQVAKRFKSDISIRKGRSSVDGKSIMGILSLAAGRGNVVELTLRGPDAEGAFHALEQILCHDEVPAVVHVVRHRRA